MTPWAGLWGLAAAGVLLLPTIEGWFQFAGLRWLFIFLLAFFLSTGMVPLCHWAARRLGLIDRPDHRKRHAQPTPKLGGIAVYLGVLGALAANSILLEGMGAVLAAATLMLCVGLIDDWRGVPAPVRLIVQFAAVAVVMASGRILTLFPPTTVGFLIDIVVTALWIIGITNAFNFFDGMDGLAGGLTVVIAGFMGVMAFQTAQPLLGRFAMALIGAVLGFLLYNWRWRRPALIFLGDGGSAFIGFVLACLAVKGNWADNNPIVSLSNPLLIFGVLIFDMIHITAARLLSGRVRSFREWIDYVGTDHLHHRLIEIFGSERMTVWFILGLNGILGLAAVALRHARTVDAVLLILQAVMILLLVTLLEHHAHRHRAP